jgi:hypothetical protein
MFLAVAEKRRVGITSFGISGCRLTMVTAVHVSGGSREKTGWNQLVWDFPVSLPTIPGKVLPFFTFPRLRLVELTTIRQALKTHSPTISFSLSENSLPRSSKETSVQW